MKTAKTYLDSICIHSNYAQMEGISLSSSTSASLKSVLHQFDKQKCFKQSFTVISLQKIVLLTIKKNWMFIITKLHRSRSIYWHISNLLQTWFLDFEESYSYLWKNKDSQKKTPQIIKNYSIKACFEQHSYNTMQHITFTYLFNCIVLVAYGFMCVSYSIVNTSIISCEYPIRIFIYTILKTDY